MKNDPLITFPIESDKELSGGLLRSLAVGILAISMMFIVSTLLFFHELIWRAVIFGGSALFICIWALWLVRREKFRLGGIVLAVFLWLLISFGSYTAGGITAPIFIGYVAVILISALVLGTGTGLLFVFLTIGFGAFMIYAGTNQFLPASAEYSPTARLSIYSFFLFVILMLHKTALDTTRNAIARVHTSENQYRSFLENISTVTYINDLSPNALTTYVSPQVKKMLGYSNDEFLKNPELWMEIIFPEDRENVVAKSRLAAETGAPFKLEYRFFSKDNRIVWIRDDASLV